MPEPGHIVITIRKEVASQTDAEAIWLGIKARLADQPGLTATAKFVNTLQEDLAP